MIRLFRRRVLLDQATRLLTPLRAQLLLTPLPDESHRERFLRAAEAQTKGTS